jgi:hypothetical protein
MQMFRQQGATATQVQLQKGPALVQTRGCWWGPHRQNLLMKQTQHLQTPGKLLLCA